MDLRRTVALVAGLNLAAFGGEALVALAIGSVALLADSLDFLEDSSINFLILLGLGWGGLRAGAAGQGPCSNDPAARPRHALDGLEQTPRPAAPDPLALTLTAGAALLVNLLAALLISRHRTGAARSPARPSCRRATTSPPTR
jgi:Co/Zn/Cd efflux system component